MTNIFGDLLKIALYFSSYSEKCTFLPCRKSFYERIKISARGSRGLVDVSKIRKEDPIKVYMSEFYMNLECNSIFAKKQSRLN